MSKVIDEITGKVLLERGFVYRLDAYNIIQTVPCIIRYKNRVKLRQTIDTTNMLREEGFERTLEDNDRTYWTLKA